MSEPKKTESFAGNVMKYSIATYLGFGISGAALIIKGVLPAESYAVPASFMAYTMSLMNVGMLGLDQSLLRFYHEPPAGSTGRSMFAACTRLSVLVMLLVGGIGSIFFAKPLAAAFGLGANGAGLVPFLFLNAALYMLVRYLNVLLRLENNVRAYTTETLWMQACLNLIYLLPGFVTQDARAFVLGAVCSFAGVAVFYWRRDCYYKTIKKMSNVEMIEQFTGFGLYDKSFIQTLRDLHDPTPFLRGIVAELGPERKEIEYTQPKRRAGKTHNNWYSLFDAAMLSFTSYTKIGMRMAEFFGFFCAAVSFILGLVFLVAKLIHWNTFAAGYAPMIIAVFFVGGVQLTFLGFLGEYIMAMNARIMDRPLVVEEKRLNFEPETPESDVVRAQ